MKAAHVLMIVLMITGLMLALPPAATSKAAWEQKWESTLAEAKKEGVVMLYTLWGPEVTNRLRPAFKKKYGIELEFLNTGRGSAMVPKVRAERAAGLYLPDVFGFGATSLLAAAKPADLLGPLEPLLILPEVTDPNLWSGGKFPFIDKDRQAIGMALCIQRYLLYNTDLIKEGEITTYKDVLKPQYKGKIVLGDPSQTGTANAMFGHLAYTLWNMEEATEFMRRLIQEQEPVILRQERFVVEWVARGKYPIGLGSHSGSLCEFLKAGAHITLAVQKEGHMVDYAGGALGVPTKSPHPNATAVFVNWLLTQEGQTLFARGYGWPSLRKDINPDWVPPILVPKPGEKLFSLSEEEIVGRRPLLGLAKKIVEEASRK